MQRAEGKLQQGSSERSGQGLSRRKEIAKKVAQRGLDHHHHPSLVVLRRTGKTSRAFSCHPTTHFPIQGTLENLVEGFNRERGEKESGGRNKGSRKTLTRSSPEIRNFRVYIPTQSRQPTLCSEDSARWPR